MSGWWCNNHLEKYESQLGGLFPIYGKIKHVPNHQPDVVQPPFVEFNNYIQWALPKKGMVLRFCLFTAKLNDPCLGLKYCGR